MIFALLVSLGMYIGLQLQNGLPNSSLILKSEDFQEGKIGKVEEIIRFIDSKYISEIAENDILENALKSILSDLDPHSVYISPNQLSKIKEEMGGKYVGIGIETIFLKDSLYIIKVIKDSPADIAGLQLFDVVESINNNAVLDNGLTHADVEKCIGNVKMTHLKICKRNGKRVKENVTVEHGEIELPSIDLAYPISDSIGYIRITKFSSHVYKEFMEKLEALAQDKDFLHLVIDLRDNPGGYLPEATNILSQLFSEKDRLLVYTQGRDGSKTEYKSTGRPFFDVRKIAVLVDHGSASGSEIIAGAVQDWDRGVIVGDTTYGKGLVQEQFALENGGALRLTVAKYFTPTGRCIQKDYNDNPLIESENIDTTEYYTKLLKRKIYGNGGILPDELVTSESIFYKIGGDKNIIEYSSEFAIDFILKNNGEHLIDSQKIDWKKYNLSSMFANYVTQKTKKPYTTRVKEYDIETYLKYKILFYNNDADTAYKFLQEGDEYISKAISYMKNENLFALKKSH